MAPRSKNPKPTQSVSIPVIAGTSKNATTRAHSMALLCQELELHHLTASDAQAVASELHLLANVHHNESQRSNAAIRKVLHKLRHLRNNGELVSISCLPDRDMSVAQKIWARDFAGESTAKLVCATQQFISPNAEEGIRQVVPPMPVDKGKICFIVNNVLTNIECQQFLEQADGHGWQPAGFEYGLDSDDRAGDAVVNVRLRDSDRSIIHDDVLAKTLWQRLQSFIPTVMFEPLRPVRINSCFRCLRYSEGQAGFAKHCDGRCVVAGEVSRVTIMIYLNEDFKGGATRLCVMDDAEDCARGIDVVPQKGMAFVFDQSILHKGCPVTQGTKYSARTEIMYSGNVL